MLRVPYFKQNRDYTCGPACLRMVLAYYGIEQDEVTLTMLCRTNVFGTSLDAITTAATQLGLNAEWIHAERLSDAMNLLTQETLLIAHVDAVRLYQLDKDITVGHLIVLLAVQETAIYFHDPEAGADRSVALADFEAAWSKFEKGMVAIWR